MRRASVKPYLYLAPVLAFSGLVVLYPIVQVILYSLSDWRALDHALTGTLDNFLAIFHDRIFWEVIANNAKVLLNVPVQIAIAVIFASLLFGRVAGWRIYQVSYFIPTILPIVVVGLMWTIILRVNGLLNSLLRLLGLGKLARLWLGDVHWSLASSVGVMIWKDVGFVILLFLSPAEHTVGDIRCRENRRRERLAHLHPHHSPAAHLNHQYLCRPGNHLVVH